MTYMNGKNIIRKTEELTDAIWRALIPAYIGACGAIALGIFAKRTWDQYRDQAITPLVCCILILAAILVFWYFCKPWCDAALKLNKHTNAVKAETKKRGKGWAES